MSRMRKVSSFFIMFAHFSAGRAWRRRTTALSVVALMFTHLNVAAACVCPDLDSEKELGAAQFAPSANESDVELDSQQPLPCHEQCKAEIALSDIELPGLPLAPFTGLVVAQVDWHRAVLTSRAARTASDHLTTLSPRILFCVFRN